LTPKFSRAEGNVSESQYKANKPKMKRPVNKPGDSKPNSMPKRPKRPLADILKEFEEEEKKFREANAEFVHDHREKKRRARAHTNEHKDEYSFDEIEIQNVDRRAAHWKGYKDKQALGTTNGDQAENLVATDQGGPDKFTCWICRRKFLSKDLLHLHEAMSYLHQVNLTIVS